MDESVPAVILAGGRGRRLEPFTSVLPKPLMPVGDRAILEIAVDRLVECGIHDITLCVGLSRAPDRGSAQRPPAGGARDIRPRAHTARDGRPATADRRPRSDVPPHERRPSHRPPLRRARRAASTGGERGDDRDPRADERDRLWRPAHGARRVAASRGIRREDRDSTLTVSMGIYVMEPEALDVIPERRVLRLPTARRPAPGAGAPGRDVPVRRATGSTSAAATTTSARSWSGSRTTPRPKPRPRPERPRSGPYG